MTVTAILPLPAGLHHDAVFGPVAGASPLQRIVDALAPRADVVIGTPEAVAGLVSDSLGTQGRSVRVVVADSPGSRAQCVAAALAVIDDDASVPLRDDASVLLGAGPSVLLHDIEWPVLPAALLDRIIAALRTSAVAVLPVLPVTDSVKVVSTARQRPVVTATLDRAGLRSVQFPRGYAAGMLAALLAADSDGEFDDLALALASGIPLTLVDGDAEAVTVELPRDADYLNAVLRSTPNPAER